MNLFLPCSTPSAATRFVSRLGRVGEFDTIDWVYLNRQTANQVPLVALEFPELIYLARDSILPPLCDQYRLSQVRPADSPEWMASSLFVHSHTVQCALYPLYYAQSPHDVEFVQLEHLAKLRVPQSHRSRSPLYRPTHSFVDPTVRLCICVDLASSIGPALGRSLRSLRFCTRLSNILLNAKEARRDYSPEVTGSPQWVHACFAQPVWTRCHRSAGGIVLQTRSSNAHHPS